MRDYVEVRLQEHRFMSMQRVSEEFYKALKCNIEAREARRMIQGDLEIQLMLRVLGTVPEEVTLEHPVDWWDAFKLRWFPTFVSWRIFKPARMVRKTVTKFAIYPELPSSLIRQGRREVTIPLCLPQLDSREDYYTAAGGQFPWRE